MTKINRECAGYSPLNYSHPDELVPCCEESASSAVDFSVGKKSDRLLGFVPAVGGALAYILMELEKEALTASLATASAATELGGGVLAAGELGTEGLAAGAGLSMGEALAAGLILAVVIGVGYGLLTADPDDVPAEVYADLPAMGSAEHMATDQDAGPTEADEDPEIDPATAGTTDPDVIADWLLITSNCSQWINQGNGDTWKLVDSAVEVYRLARLLEIPLRCPDGKTLDLTGMDLLHRTICLDLVSFFDKFRKVGSSIKTDEDIYYYLSMEEDLLSALIAFLNLQRERLGVLCR